jgi:hypothetical protein
MIEASFALKARLRLFDASLIVLPACFQNFYVHRHASQWRRARLKAAVGTPGRTKGLWRRTYDVSSACRLKSGDTIAPGLASVSHNASMTRLRRCGQSILPVVVRSGTYV